VITELPPRQSTLVLMNRSFMDRIHRAKGAAAHRDRSSRRYGVPAGSSNRPGVTQIFGFLGPNGAEDDRHDPTSSAFRDDVAGSSASTPSTRNDRASATSPASSASRTATGGPPRFAACAVASTGPTRPVFRRFEIDPVAARILGGNKQDRARHRPRTGPPPDPRRADVGLARLAIPTSSSARRRPRAGRPLSSHILSKGRADLRPGGIIRDGACRSTVSRRCRPAHHRRARSSAGPGRRVAACPASAT
jgi:hypothetical protein